MSLIYRELQHAVRFEGAYSEMEEEEEIVEMSESDLLKLLDQQEPALQVCSRLFRKSTEKLKPLTFLDEIEVSEMRFNGFFVKDACISEQQSRELHNEAMKLHSKGRLEEANKVRLMPDMSLDKCTDTAARGDQITWLHEGDDFRQEDSAGMHAMRVLQALQEDLHGLMKLEKRQAEYQLAVYMGGGSQYVKHRDALPDDGASANERRVTAILYANPDWRPEHGGQLRIWVPPSIAAMPASSGANTDTFDQSDQLKPCPSNQAASRATKPAESPRHLAEADAASLSAIDQQSITHMQGNDASAETGQVCHGATQHMNGLNSGQQDCIALPASGDGPREQLDRLHLEGTGHAQPLHGKLSQNADSQQLRASRRKMEGVYEHEFAGEQVIDVDPIAGRMVVFLSGAIDHAVLPSHQPRVALTAWCQ